MRDIINLYEAAVLDSTLQTLRDYILHNAAADHYEIAATLRAHGYNEPASISRVFRALIHPVTITGTLGDFLNHVRDGHLFRLSGAQGCTASLEEAHAFIGGVVHLTQYVDGRWPEHQPHTDLANVREAFVIYELEVPPSAILWTMEGLKRFAKNLDGAKASMINAALDEWDGYGHDLKSWSIPVLRRLLRFISMIAEVTNTNIIVSELYFFYSREYHNIIGKQLNILLQNHGRS